MVSAATDFTMHMDGWGAGAWILMALGMALFWGLIILGLVWLVRSFGEGGSKNRLDAREVLERRLAEGDISVEEYRERREALSDQAPHPAG
jgi:putative membrane protein